MYIFIKLANNKNMKIYKRSFKQFKKIIRKNPNITKGEWDKFAEENILYSSITLEAHTDTYSFEELKSKM